MTDICNNAVFSAKYEKHSEKQEMKLKE